jgi:hypothetical protein
MIWPFGQHQGRPSAAVPGEVLGRPALPASDASSVASMTCQGGEAWSLEPLESRALLSAVVAAAPQLPIVIDTTKPALVFQFRSKLGARSAWSVTRIDGGRQTRVPIDSIQSATGKPVALPPLKLGGLVQVEEADGETWHEKPERGGQTKTPPPDCDTDGDAGDDSGGRDADCTTPGGDSATDNSVGNTAKPVPSPQAWLELAGELLEGGMVPRPPPGSGVAVYSTSEGMTVVIVQPGAPAAPAGRPPRGEGVVVPPLVGGIARPAGLPVGVPPVATAAAFAGIPIVSEADSTRLAADVFRQSNAGDVVSAVSAPVTMTGGSPIVITAARGDSRTYFDYSAGLAGAVMFRSASVVSGGLANALAVGDDSTETPAIGLSGARFVRAAVSAARAGFDPLAVQVFGPEAWADVSAGMPAVPLGLAQTLQLATTAESALGAWKMTACVSMAIAVVGFAYCRAASKAGLSTAKQVVASTGGPSFPLRPGSSGRRRIACRVIR